MAKAKGKKMTGAPGDGVEEHKEADPQLVDGDGGSDPEDPSDNDPIAALQPFSHVMNILGLNKMDLPIHLALKEYWGGDYTINCIVSMPDKDIKELNYTDENGTTITPPRGHRNLLRVLKAFNLWRA